MTEEIKNVDGRRVFYIDVGDLTPEKAAEYLEQIKKEIQKRK